MAVMCQNRNVLKGDRMEEQTHLAITRTLLVTLVRKGLFTKEEFVEDLEDAALAESPIVAQELRDVITGLMRSTGD